MTVDRRELHGANHFVQQGERHVQQGSRAQSWAVVQPWPVDFGDLPAGADKPASVATLSEWSAAPSLHTLGRLCEFFGVEEHEILLRRRISWPLSMGARRSWRAVATGFRSIRPGSSKART